MPTATFRISRFDPVCDSMPAWQDYGVPLVPKMVVLDGLFYIQGELDGTLAFRFSCRVGMCGSCGMVINGRPRLACRTAVADLGRVVHVQPMRNMPVIRDLVVHMEPFFRNYEKVIPYFVPKDPHADPAIIPDGSPEREIIDENLGCITCGLCFSGCGMVAYDPNYLGPAALNRAYTLIADSRDALSEERLAIVADEHGVWRCHTQMECTTVCPRHLSPTKTIAKLKNKLARRALGALWPFGGPGRD